MSRSPLPAPCSEVTSSVGIEHILEPHPASIKVEIRESGGAVAVLGDDQLGRTVHAAARVVHLLAEDRQNDVGMLLRCAHDAEVVERGAFRVATRLETW